MKYNDFIWIAFFFKQFKIFVASPGDVEKERNIVDTVVGQINETIGDTLGTVVKRIKNFIANWLPM